MSIFKSLKLIYFINGLVSASTVFKYTRLTLEVGYIKSARSVQLSTLLFHKSLRPDYTQIWV